MGWMNSIIDGELLTEREWQLLDDAFDMLRWFKRTPYYKRKIEEDGNYLRMREESLWISLLVDPIKNKPIIQEFEEKTYRIFAKINPFNDKKVVKRLVKLSCIDDYLDCDCGFGQCTSRFFWKGFQLRRVRGFV